MNNNEGGPSVQAAKHKLMRWQLFLLFAMPLAISIMRVPIFDAHRRGILEGVTYTIVGFVITELSVWIPVWMFDIMEEPWKKYQIRERTAQEEQRMAELRNVAETERFNKYKSDWLIYLGTWSLSSMTFDAESPSWIRGFAQAVAMAWALDVWIYVMHWWLHNKHHIFGGYDVHAKHHSWRFVACWYVDHESATESLAIGVAKHGLLVHFSPHPWVAFFYLFITKFWNCVAHCGYKLPIFDFIDKYLPFISSPNHHELHHFHHIDVNYSVFTTWCDWLGRSLLHNDAEVHHKRFQRRRRHTQKLCDFFLYGYSFSHLLDWAKVYR